MVRKETVLNSLSGFLFW